MKGQKDEHNVCAECGNSDGGLKVCSACKSVRYCTAACQRAHRKEHRKDCKLKEKELKALGENLKSMTISLAPAPADRSTIGDTTRDTDLFAAPPPRDECPLCMLPLPFTNEESTWMSCCGKSICGGCIVANSRVIAIENMKRRQSNNEPARPMLEDCCPFCRAPDTEAETREERERVAKRMEREDPQAYFYVAVGHHNGEPGYPGGVHKALELYLRAAELGSFDACMNLGGLYHTGEGRAVERDDAKARYYFERAAKGGILLARYNLGCMEHAQGNLKLALKHFQMSATAGDTRSLRGVEKLQEAGEISHEEMMMIFRAHQKARGEIKSKERDAFIELNRHRLPRLL